MKSTRPAAPHSRGSRLPLPVMASAATILVLLLSHRTWLAAEAPDDPWQHVLERHVSAAGVDYGELADDRRELDEFLRRATVEEPAALQPDEATAFWINVYNAAVLSLVLERYPDLTSVMDVAGFFDEKRMAVAGELLTLDEIESRALAAGDPRIHFALVCAAHSCPELRREPYVGSRLRSQLDDQTRRFLADTDRGARLDREGETLWVSTLFKWYGGDFTGGSTAMAYVRRGGIVDWVLPYLPADTAAALRELEPRVRYLDYDWSLNAL